MGRSDVKKLVYEDRQSLRRDFSLELARLETSINELKVTYEQYFAGIVPLAPEREHAEIKRGIRQLMQHPFRNSVQNFQLKGIKSRFSTLETYWQRVLKQREEGVYSKDVFKANLRERQQAEEEFAQSKGGVAEGQLAGLFKSYCSEIEKQSGKSARVDFSAFEKSLIKRASALKAQYADKKLSFRVVVKNGKVSVQARLKDRDSKS